MNIDNLSSFVDCQCSPEQLSIWCEVSVRRGAIQRSPQRQCQQTDEYLTSLSRAPNMGPLRELFAYWSGAAQLVDVSEEERSNRLKYSLQCNDGDASICDMGSIQFAALLALAESSLKLSRDDEALDCLTKLCNEVDPQNTATSLDSGLLLSKYNKPKDALEFFSKCADEQIEEGALSAGQVALRYVHKLSSGQIGVSEKALPKLIRQISIAIIDRNRSAIRELASHTEFKVSAGCHYYFLSRENILDMVCTDLWFSRVKIIDVIPYKNSVVIVTDGWRGEYFRGAVQLRLTKLFGGWEWTSISISGSPRFFLRTVKPQPKETNQPLPFELLAPWDAGSGDRGASFMAGGVRKPLENPQSPTSCLRSLGGSWFGDLAGNLSRFFDFFFAPTSPHERIRILALAARECGFGPRGFYYNDSFSHYGADAFAVDFTRYDTLRAASFNHPVLSAVHGRVTGTRFSIDDDDDANPNVVEILTTVPTTDPFELEGRYIHRYLHLRRARTPPVMVGDPVDVGRYLGRIDNTGRSAFSHLHFSIHDQNRIHGEREGLTGPGLKGRSIRLRPVESTALDDRDDGECINSSNGGEPSVAITSPLAGQRVRNDLVISFGAEIRGGAAPFNVRWDLLRPNFSIFSDFNSLFRDIPNVHEFIDGIGDALVRVIVVDELGRVAEDLIEFNLVSGPASLEIVQPVNGQTFSQNDIISLRASSSVIPAGERIDNDALIWTSGSSEIGRGHEASVPANAFDIGETTIELGARAGSNDLRDVKTIQISASTGPRAPEVRIISPEPGAEFYIPSHQTALPIVLSGSARDGSGTNINASNVKWHKVLDEAGTLEELGSGFLLSEAVEIPGEQRTLRIDILLTAEDEVGVLGEARTYFSLRRIL